jgi:hypothetical protein
MTPPTKVDLVIYQGATFKWPFYWYTEVEVSKVITAISCTYPTVITAGTHGLPDSDVPVAIVGVGSWLNTTSVEPSDRIYGSKIDTNTLSVKVDTTGHRYTGTAGRVVYNAPKDMTGWTARMQIRAAIDDDTVIEEFTTEDGHISVDTDGLIQLDLTDTETDALSFDPAVWDIEVIDPDTSEVTRLAYGSIVLSPQVTRTP